MEKKAIAYTAEALEKKTIEEYAKENAITIVAWFEEEARTENPLARPKLKEALACNIPHEVVLIERVWSISRKWNEVRGVLAALEAKNARVECATNTWDCVSMMARNHCRNAVSVTARAPKSAAKSINLVETYGRAAHKERVAVNAPSWNKAAVRNPALALEKS